MSASLDKKVNHGFLSAIGTYITSVSQLHAHSSMKCHVRMVLRRALNAFIYKLYPNVSTKFMSQKSFFFIYINSTIFLNCSIPLYYIMFSLKKHKEIYLDYTASVINSLQLLEVNIVSSYFLSHMKALEIAFCSLNVSSCCDGLGTELFSLNSL